MEEEVAAGCGDPDGILEMRVDAEPDAALFARCTVLAKTDDRIARAPVAAHPVQVQDGMAANTARKLGAEAGLLLELGDGAKLGIVGKESGVGLFRIGAWPSVEMGRAAGRERERGDDRQRPRPKVPHQCSPL